MRQAQDSTIARPGWSRGTWRSLLGIADWHVILYAPAWGSVGAASGALAGTLSDFGIEDNFIREVGNAIQPGEVALFLLTSNEVADKVLPELKAF